MIPPTCLANIPVIHTSSTQKKGISIEARTSFSAVFGLVIQAQPDRKSGYVLPAKMDSGTNHLLFGFL